ncbi:TetR/AcrR family transcriptional regulator [Halalkalibacter okhensis]|uniref:TetR/AcrR family transcriptional regulator n=1 Tax=Halalkalibacter okhensis TaxID=333138 RepID=UPI0006902FF8|nr:TetR/AcrR family transcriptional regulator [Halalkalibacter okhensis]
MSTKESIIEAATVIFANKGYKGMTMKEIASEVGIKAPSVYAFFRSKEDVFLHIYQEVLKGHLELTMKNNKQSHHKSVKEQLDHLLYHVLDFQFKESLKMKVYLRLMLFPPEFMKDTIKEGLLQVDRQEHAMFCSMFEKGMESGEIKQADSSKLATSLICMMDGLFWEMQRYEKETLYNRFEVIWEQFWLGIKS